MSIKVKKHYQFERRPKARLLWLLACSPFGGMFLIVGYTGILFLSGTVTLSERCASPWSMWYLFGVPFLIMLASLAGIRAWSLKASNLGKNSEFGRGNATQWGLIMGLLSLIAAVVSNVAFIKAGLGASLQANRDAFTFNLLEYSMYWRLMGPLMPFAFFATVFLSVYFEEFNNGARLCLALGIVSVVLVSTIYLGGREMIVMELVSGLWCCGYRKLVGRPFFPKSLALRAGTVGVCVLLCMIIVFVPVSRSGSGNQADATLGLMSTLVKTSDASTEVLEKLSPGAAITCADALVYSTSACAVFDRALSEWKIRPDFLGAFFPMLQRRFASLGVIPGPEAEAAEFGAIASENGFYHNWWPTTAFDMVKSFGVVGGLCVLMVVSFLAGSAYRKALERHSFTTICFSLLIFLFLLLWFSRTLFYDPMYEYALYWLLLISLYRLFSNGRAARSRARRQIEPVPQSLPSGS